LQYDTAMVNTVYKLGEKTFHYGIDCDGVSAKSKRNLLMLSDGAADSGLFAAVAVVVAAFFF
jgi:hypothetical protein